MTKVWFSEKVLEQAILEAADELGVVETYKEALRKGFSKHVLIKNLAYTMWVTGYTCCEEANNILLTYAKAMDAWMQGKGKVVEFSE